MSERLIRCYQYVNQPYDRVVERVRANPEGLFRGATDAASSRAESVATGLSVDVAGLAVGTDIEIEIEGVEEVAPRPTKMARVTHMKLRWQAAKRPGLFPTMRAQLSFYALSPTETQIDLEGHYEPPGGALGAAADAVVGHRIAEAAVHRLVDEIAERLKAELADAKR